MLLFRAADVAAYRAARVARLAGQLRAAAEPRDAERWDAEELAPLDLALEVEERERRR